MEFNEIESSENIKRSIQMAILPRIKLYIQEMYKDEVCISSVETYYIIRPCLYVKEEISEKILFYKLKRENKRMLVMADVSDTLEIKVWVYDSIIYPVVRNEFERFGKEHTESITKITMIKKFQY